MSEQDSSIDCSSRSKARVCLNNPTVKQIVVDSYKIKYPELFKTTEASTHQESLPKSLSSLEKIPPLAGNGAQSEVVPENQRPAHFNDKNTSDLFANQIALTEETKAILYQKRNPLFFWQGETNSQKIIETPLKNSESLKNIKPEQCFVSDVTLEDGLEILQKYHDGSYGTGPKAFAKLKENLQGFLLKLEGPHLTELAKLQGLGYSSYRLVRGLPRGLQYLAYLLYFGLQPRIGLCHCSEQLH